MSGGGFSGARLARMHDDVMAGHVERGVVPGILTLVSRRGEVQVEAIGTKAFGGSYPMRRDTIFRLGDKTDRGRGGDDPGEEMVGILLTQRALDAPGAPAVLLDFWTSAYGAIDD